MTKWTTADIPDQTGRVAVITGANTGLGYETAHQHSPSTAPMWCWPCATSTRAKTPPPASPRLGPRGEVALQEVDLTSLESVRAAARQLRSDYDRIDLLINNAGVMYPPKSNTKDGFELQFGTDHLGHSAFTRLSLTSCCQSPVPGS